MAENGLKIRLRNLTPSRLYGWYALLRRVFLRLYYTGKTFSCPFCQRHYRKFIAAGSSLPIWKEKKIIGGGFRENAYCPWCNSADRERLIYLYIKKETNLLKKDTGRKKLLHIAPGKNLGWTLKKSQQIEYISGDLNPDRRLVMERIDITAIPYPNNYFDAIICSHVLEHVVNDTRAMRELYRVLSPEGWAILQVPVSLLLESTYEDWSADTPEKREKYFGQSDHVRIYGRDYKNRLEEAGFKVLVFNPEKEWGNDFIFKYAIQKNEDLYICTK